jgi:hypothetical protein
MLLLLARRGGEARLDADVARDERLRGIERLRADFALCD